MRVRALDGSNDFTFGQGFGSYKRELDALGQNCATRIRSFLGDCFFDTGAGIDWLNLLEKGKQKNLRDAIQSTILTTTGITGINSFDFFVDEKRELTINYNVATIYSSSYSGTVTNV